LARQDGTLQNRQQPGTAKKLHGKRDSALRRRKKKVNPSLAFASCNAVFGIFNKSATSGNQQPGLQNDDNFALDFLLKSKVLSNHRYLIGPYCPNNLTSNFLDSRMRRRVQEMLI
jgi:hypothetical protein